GAQRPLDAAAFCGLCTAGSSPSRFPGNGTPAGGKLQPMYWPLPTGSRANVHCRALSTAGPSSGIVDIHFPMRERSCSSGLAAFAGGAESGIDSGGTGCLLVACAAAGGGAMGIAGGKGGAADGPTAGATMLTGGGDETASGDAGLIAGESAGAAIGAGVGAGAGAAAGAVPGVTAM